METVINIMNSLPGERFRFRMIGTPKSWHRYFLEDGSYMDLEKSIGNMPCTKMFATFARDMDSECCQLAGRFKAVGVLPGAADGVDVDISILGGNIRYLIDIGNMSTLDDPDIIDGMESMWDSVKGDVISYVTAQDIISTPKESFVEWHPRKWAGMIDTNDAENIKSVLAIGDYRNILASFLQDVTDIKDEEMAMRASRIIRAMRIIEDS
jgi:hypothetical protein